MSKIAVIGTKKAFLPLRALGFAVFEARNPDHARDMLEENLKKREFSIIFLSENLADESYDLINKWNEESRETFVFILPEEKGNIGILEERISMLTKGAVGTDIITK